MIIKLCYKANLAEQVNLISQKGLLISLSLSENLSGFIGSVSQKNAFITPETKCSVLAQAWKHFLSPKMALSRYGFLLLRNVSFGSRELHCGDCSRILGHATGTPSSSL